MLQSLKVNDKRSLKCKICLIDTIYGCRQIFDRMLVSDGDRFIQLSATIGPFRLFRYNNALLCPVARSQHFSYCRYFRCRRLPARAHCQQSIHCQLLSPRLCGDSHSSRPSLQASLGSAHLLPNYKNLSMKWRRVVI
ncbi:hypothetical protein J6590_015912 [Homalodisca vitripennis]|nr:hypothetical protein J6590_015912 [Homalodisca vitripennis]